MNKSERRQRAIERRRQDVKDYRKLLDSKSDKEGNYELHGKKVSKKTILSKLAIAEKEVEKFGEG